MSKKIPLVILTGPTAVGKTELSIELAKRIGGEIISADSIQIYKYMDIGSAKVAPEEMQVINHYLIDELYPDDEFNIYVFKKMAMDAINTIIKHHKIPIISGGTGFYIQSILYNINFSDSNDNSTEYRLEMENLAKTNGNHYVHELLRAIDPESADAIHENNLKRVIRALEFYNQTGTKISTHNKEQRLNSSPFNFAYFVLERNRDNLYSRINERVDIMLENGLVDEVKGLMDKGYSKDLVSMQGIGYKEIISYLSNEIDYEQAVETIKLNTRHFAKRQMTWFRREKEVQFLSYEKYCQTNDMINAMINYLNSKSILTY